VRQPPFGTILTTIDTMQRGHDSFYLAITIEAVVTREIDLSKVTSKNSAADVEISRTHARRACAATPPEGIKSYASIWIGYSGRTL